MRSGRNRPGLSASCYTAGKLVETTLLLKENGMETAKERKGKLVDNDELRDALKENGIGRPSTRAAIIETLFKRNYIRKEKEEVPDLLRPCWGSFCSCLCSGYLTIREPSDYS